MWHNGILMPFEWWWFNSRPTHKRRKKNDKRTTFSERKHAVIYLSLKIQIYIFIFWMNEPKWETNAPRSWLEAVYNDNDEREWHLWIHHHHHHKHGHEHYSIIESVLVSDICFSFWFLQIHMHTLRPMVAWCFVKHMIIIGTFIQHFAQPHVMIWVQPQFLLLWRSIMFRT